MQNIGMVITGIGKLEGTVLFFKIGQITQGNKKICQGISNRWLESGNLRGRTHIIKSRKLYVVLEKYGKRKEKRDLKMKGNNTK